MINIIPKRMADELIMQGVIKGIEKESPPFKVIFGKKGAISDIDCFIRGAGLLDKVYVSSDIRVALISDISFTDKGITIIKTSQIVRGISNDESTIFEGHRDRSSSDKALWLLDIIQLLRAPHPDISSSTSRSTDSSVSADSLEHLQCYSSRPTHSPSDVREGRRLQKCTGALHAIASTIESGGISDVPQGLTPALLRKIADQSDYIPYELSHRRKYTQGGSGIHGIRPGAEMSFDELGKWIPSTFGATGAILISDRATGVCIPYAIHSKTAVIDVMIVYCRFINSFGLKVEHARCDKTSMATADQFKAACAQLQIHVIPAPAEQQNQNPLERSWQTIQNDAAGLLVSQRNLCNKHWFLAICTACTIRACMLNSSSILVYSKKTP